MHRLGQIAKALHCFIMMKQQRRHSLPPLKSPRKSRHPVDAFHHKNNNDDNLSVASGVAVAPVPPSNVATPYSGIIQKHVNNDGDEDYTSKEPVFGLSRFHWAERYFLRRGHNNGHNATPQKTAAPVDNNIEDVANHYYEVFDSSLGRLQKNLSQETKLTNGVTRFLLVLVLTIVSKFTYESIIQNSVQSVQSLLKLFPTSHKVKRYPDFVFDHPYVTSSYYISTSNIDLLEKMQQAQVEPYRDRPPDRERGIVSRLAIMRPFCEFDAGPLPTTFACWNSLVPCRAAEDDLGVEEDEEEWVLFDMSVNGMGRKLPEDEKDDWECEVDFGASSSSSNVFRGIANNLPTRCKRRKPKHKEFDDVPADRLRTTSVDLFLFYSQTFSENDEAVNAVDTIMEEFFTPGGWSRCFDNIYAVEANIPQELDLYIPTAQEELYNWVNGPNRQYEAGFRIIQSGEWGDYDGFYLMEGDSVRCPCVTLFVHVSPVCSL